MRIVFLPLLWMCSMTANAEMLKFDRDPAGQPPAGWTCGATGTGNPRWTVEPDSTAAGAPKVLRQSGQAAFPWCVRTGTSLADGYVEVRFKPISGREDQA